MIHLVALERVPQRGMESFVDKLSSEDSFWKVMPNVWLVDTTLDAEALTKKLRRYISDSDTLLVIRVTDDYSGWLKQEAWDWLEASEENGDFD